METITAIALLSRTVAFLLLAVLGVRASTTTGETIEGDLVGFGKQTILLDVAGTEQEYRFENLTKVVPLEREEKTGPSMRVTLLSGSKIAVQDLSLANDELTAEPRRQRPLSIPLREVKSVRFRAASPATDAGWLGLLENEDRRDQLAIRRDGNRIDPAPVVVQSIGDGKVGFEIEGQSAAAPISRLEGVVFGGNRKVTEDAEIQIVDIYGSRWLVQSIEPGDAETLQLKLTDTIKHSLPAKHLESMSWSAGLLMLAAEEPAKSEYKPLIETKLNPETLAKWMGPRADQESSLTMAGGSSIEYRVEGGFRTLAGSVRRDPRVAKAGQVEVAISLDDREVWKEKLADSSAKGFEILLNNARRLRIDVLSGDDGDVGDIVRIVRPRLLK